MKLAIYGGSTAAGFGVKGGSYAALVADRLGMEFANHAGPSAIVSDSLQWVDRAKDADLVLVMHGSGEALVRPSSRSLRFMPPRWRRRGWMDPRAYFSPNRLKALPQRVESAVRWRMKVLLIRLSGGEWIMDLDDYERETRKFVRALKDAGAARIALVGSTGMDDRYFPRSAERIVAYDAATSAIAEEEGALFINALEVCDRWGDYFGDHLHPAAAGHRRLAAHILAELGAAGVTPAPDAAAAA